ncbi:hypothetical protein AVEN_212780-1, partial [Araneus ventricosus]
AAGLVEKGSLRQGFETRFLLRGLSCIEPVEPSSQREPKHSPRGAGSLERRTADHVLFSSF